MSTSSPATQRQRLYLPDGGWGWLVVFGCAIHTFVGGGLQRNFSLIYENMRDRFGTNAADTSWVYSINATVSLMIAPITAMLVARFTSRPVVMTGGILVTLGIVGMAYATSLPVVYFAFGAISGIGNGLIQCPKFIAISHWFELRRGRATSLATMMDGFGAMAMSPLLQYWFIHYNYSGAILLLGGLTIQYTVGGALLRHPLPDEMRKARLRGLEDDRSKGYAMTRPESQTNEKDIHNETRECDEYMGISKGMFRHLDIPAGSIDDIYVYSRRKSQSLDDLGGELDNIRNDIRRTKGHPRIWKSHGDISVPYHIYGNKNDIALTGESSVRDGVDSETGDITNKDIKYSTNKCLKYFDYRLLQDRVYLSFNLFAICLSIGLSMINTHFAGLCKERNLSLSEVTLLLATMGGVNTTFKFLSGFLFDWSLIRPHRKHIFCLMGAIFGLTLTLAPYMPNAISYYIVWIVFIISGSVIATQESLILADIVSGPSFASAIGLNRFFRGFGVLLGPTFGGFLKDTTGVYTYTFVLTGSVLVCSSVFLEISTSWVSLKKKIFN